MEVLRKIGNAIVGCFICLLVVVVFAMGVLFIQTKTNPDSIPNLFGYKPFIVLSGSMETEIYEGDLVIVKEIDNYDDLKVNDIIAFKTDEKHVTTHRIVKVSFASGELRYTTRGDNNNRDDSGYVVSKDIEGIYVYKISGLGRIVLALQKPISLIVILIILGLIGLIFFFNDRGKIKDDFMEEYDDLKKVQEENQEELDNLRKVSEENQEELDFLRKTREEELLELDSLRKFKEEIDAKKKKTTKKTTTKKAATKKTTKKDEEKEEKKATKKKVEKKETKTKTVKKSSKKKDE